MKKTFTILSLFLALTLFFSCGEKKVSTNAPLEGYTTTLDDFEDDELPSNLLEAGVKSGMTATVVSINNDGLTIKIKELHKTFTVSPTLIKIDSSAIERIVPACVSNEDWAIDFFYLFYRKDGKLSVEESVKILNQMISYAKGNLGIDLSKKDYDCPGFDKCCSILADVSDLGGNNTNIYHILAEKTSFKALEKARAEYYTECFDENSHTPLIRAILAGNFDASRFYYEKKAVMTAKDFSGKSAVDYAKESKNEDIRNLFAVADIDMEELAKNFLPELKERKLKDDFKMLWTYAVPYTSWKTASEKHFEINEPNLASYMEEFAILNQEEMLNGTGAEENTDAASENSSESDMAFLYAEKDGEPSEDMDFQLKSEPNGNDAGKLPYGTLVTILQRSENTEVINFTEDYWYKVSGKVEGKTVEGWCFGDMLIYPVTSSIADGYKEKMESFIQDAFAESSYVTVAAEDNVVCADGKSYSVKPEDSVEILYQFNGKDSNSYYEFIGNVTNEKDDFEYPLNTFYPYYIVRKIGSQPGLISGKNLVHAKINTSFMYDSFDPSNFYISYKKDIENEYWYADVFECKNSKSRKFDFMTPDGEFAVEPQNFMVGPIIHGDTHPEVTIASIRDFTNRFKTLEEETVEQKARMFLFSSTIQYPEDYEYDFDTRRERRTFYFTYVNDYYASNCLSVDDDCDFYGSGYDILDCYLSWEENEAPKAVVEQFRRYYDEWADDYVNNCHRTYYNFDSNQYVEDHSEDVDELYEK